jgi:hypothetical protein
MISHDLKRILEDLKWDYGDIKFSMIYESISKLNISYDQGIKIAMRFENKPSVKKLINGFRDIAQELNLTNRDLYVLISLDIEEEYYREALDATLKYGFVIPAITASYDNLQKYCQRVTMLPPDLYELAWVYIYAQGYNAELTAPEKCTMPELWANYGVLAE